MRAVFTVLLTISMLYATPAMAQVEDPILSMPDGQVILNISATERKEVEQDLLVANLSFTITNRDPKFVQNEINKTMAKALETAKKVNTVKVNTGSYQVYETTEPRTKEKLWRGQQNLTLKSMEADDVLELAGKLQDMGLNMNGLSYMLAPKTAVEVQDNLMEAALKQLQERADRAAAALGKSKADLRDVSVQSSGIPYHPVHHARGMAMASSMEMVAPVAAAGETTIQLTVSARALLKP
ncbi:MAG: SIMPL domain-containing protein [Pseudomonadota bacterium]